MSCLAGLIQSRQVPGYEVECSLRLETEREEDGCLSKLRLGAIKTA